MIVCNTACANDHQVSKLIYTNGILVMTMSIFGLCCLLLYTLQKRFSFSGALPL